MSHEEQDQIHGRLLRQRGESRKRQAAISAKLKDAGSALNHAFHALSDLAKSSSPPDAARRAIQELPDKTELLALVEEAIAEQLKMSEIEMQLADFGPE